MMSKHISLIGKSSLSSSPIKGDLCEVNQPRKKMCFAKHFDQHDLLEFLSSLNHQIEQTLIKVNLNLNKKDIQKNSLTAIKWISKKIEPINCLICKNKEQRKQKFQTIPTLIQLPE